MKCVIPHMMNEIKCEKMPDLQDGSKNIACIGEESYLDELMQNSNSIQRMQDFIKRLDLTAMNQT